MNRIAFIFITVFLWVSAAVAQFDNPFSVEVREEAGEVLLDVSMPEGHYLYVDHFHVTDAVGNDQKILSMPEPVMISDPNTDGFKPVYAGTFTGRFAWAPQSGGAQAIHVKYWGCNDQVCFIPQDQVVELSDVDVMVVEKSESRSFADWERVLEGFEVKQSHSGSLNASEFIEFLENNDSDGEKLSGFRLFVDDPVAFVRKSGIFLTLIFILLGGLALNLTPCVLPMIPVNLAVIGAGAQSGSKRRGLALGAVYGLGMALVYGGLGVMVVLTGSQFGAIQSSPWFNIAIALVFAVLALAMFDLFHIDFSRFQSKLGAGVHNSGSFHVALAMGAVAALLAGACVAPVVIAVLLLASHVYEANPVAGLFLPFVLGLGMALPWPFAGAGMSVLPKPGKWMESVKYAFGAVILMFALYYGHLGYRGFLPTEVAHGIDGRTNEGFADALMQAKDEGTPVLIDFSASWCKNCVYMDKTTFKDAGVIKRLEGFAFIKYVSEDPQNPATQAVWEYFGVQGLPTFVLLDVK